MSRRPDGWFIPKSDRRYGMEREARRKLGRARRECRERDGWACVICAAQFHPTKGERPTVHHKAGWAEHPQLRADVRNLVTLCPDCESYVHSKRGAEIRQEWEQEALAECVET